jgi:hypothetical protein
LLKSGTMTADPLCSEATFRTDGHVRLFAPSFGNQF